MVSVETKGGKKLQTFLERVRDPAFISRHALRSLKRRYLPELKSNMPVRTGVLKGRLRLQARGKNIGLIGPYYGPYVRWRRAGKTLTVRSESQRILKKHQRQVARDVIRAARRQL